MFNVFNILLVINYSLLFTSYVNILDQYLGYYAKYSYFNLKVSKSKVSKAGNLGLHILESLAGFHWGNFNYFVMMSNETRQLQMYENNGGSCFRLNVDPGIQLLSIDQCLAWPTVVQMMVFFSQLSVSRGAFSLFHQIMFINLIVSQ